jgi:hypothetical protein
VAFLDADDWWMPEKLELSIEVLKSGADIVYHDLVRAGTRRNFLSKNIISSRKVSRPVFQNLVEKGNALLNSSVVIRRDIAKEVGELSEAPQLVGGEDLEYWLRISKITENFSRIPQALGYYWIGNSNTFSPERAISSLTELRKNHFGSSNKSNSPVWVAFALAKANYLLAQHDDALMELSSIKFRNQNLSYFFKIIVLKLLIFVERRFGFNLRSYMR